VFYPQNGGENGDRIVTIDSITSLHLHSDVALSALYQPESSTANINIHNHKFTMQKVAAVLTANGRVVVAVYGITLAPARYSLPFAMGGDMPSSQKCPFPWGDPSPRLIRVVLWAHPSPYPKTASRLVQPFCRVHGCVQQTHRQTHRPRYLCSNRPHLCAPCMRCDW